MLPVGCFKALQAFLKMYHPSGVILKTPLILVSGLLCNELVWSHQIKNLSDIVLIKVICPNQDTPQKMVEEILTHSPDQFALAGHSTRKVFVD